MEFLIEFVIAIVVGIGQQVFMNFLFKPFVWVCNLFAFPTEESFGFEDEILEPEPVLATITRSL